LAILAKAREKAEKTGSDRDSGCGPERSTAYGRQRPALQGIDRGQNKNITSDNSSLGFGSDESDGE